jgi:hypothetical protein
MIMTCQVRCTRRLHAKRHEHVDGSHELVDTLIAERVSSAVRATVFCDGSLRKRRELPRQDVGDVVSTDEDMASVFLVEERWVNAIRGGTTRIPNERGVLRVCEGEK